MNKNQQITIDIVKQLVRDAFEEGLDKGFDIANGSEMGPPLTEEEKQKYWSKSSTNKQFK